MMSDALANALAFADRDLPVIPLFGVVNVAPKVWRCQCARGVHCESPGKHPHGGLVARGLIEASADDAVIERWHRTAPGINFGVCTAGLIVLDVDGDAGRASLSRLERQHGPLPLTWRVATGSGGRHIYFSSPRGVIARNSASKLAKGLDIRANGGYVVIPGSRHITGHLYHWFKDVHPSDRDMAPAPAWLLHELAEPKRKAPRPVEEYRALAAAPVPNGERNTKLAQLTGHLLANCVDVLVVHELIQAFNESRCRPPLGADEVERIVCSIAAAELRKRSSADD